MAAAAGSFLLIAGEGAPDQAGNARSLHPADSQVSGKSQTHLQIGPIIQFATSLVQDPRRRAATRSRRRASSRVSMSAVDDPQLEVLLACFEGHKRAGKSRRQLGRRINGGAAAILDEVVLSASTRRARCETSDPRRVVAGTLTPAVTWGLFGLLASGGWSGLVDLGGGRCRVRRRCTRTTRSTCCHEERAQARRDALVARTRRRLAGVRPWRRCEGPSRRHRDGPIVDWRASRRSALICRPRCSAAPPARSRCRRRPRERSAEPRRPAEHAHVPIPGSRRGRARRTRDARRPSDRRSAAVQTELLIRADTCRPVPRRESRHRGARLRAGAT